MFNWIQKYSFAFVCLHISFLFFSSLFFSQRKQKEDRLNIDYNNIISNVVNNHGLCDTHSATHQEKKVGKNSEKIVWNEEGD